MSEYIFIMPKEQRISLHTQFRNEAGRKTSKSDPVYSEQAARIINSLEHKAMGRFGREESLEKKELRLLSVLKQCEKNEKSYHWYAPFQMIWGDILQKLSIIEQNQERKRELLENADKRFAKAMEIYESISEISGDIENSNYSFNFLGSVYRSWSLCVSERIKIFQDYQDKQYIIEKNINTFERIISEYKYNTEAYTVYGDFLYNIYEDERINERKKYYLAKSLDMALKAVEHYHFCSNSDRVPSWTNNIDRRLGEYMSIEININIRTDILHDIINRYRKITKSQNNFNLTSKFAEFLCSIYEYENNHMLKKSIFEEAIAIYEDMIVNRISLFFDKPESCFIQAYRDYWLRLSERVEREKLVEEGIRRYEKALKCSHKHEQKNIQKEDLELDDDLLQMCSNESQEEDDDTKKILNFLSWFVNSIKEGEADWYLYIGNELYETLAAKKGNKDSFWEDWGYFIQSLTDKMSDSYRKKELLMLSLEKYEKSWQCLPSEKSKYIWEHWGEALRDLAFMSDDPAIKHDYIVKAVEKYEKYLQMDTDHSDIRLCYGSLLFDLAEFESDIREKEKLYAAAKSNIAMIRGSGSELSDVAYKENNPAKKKMLFQFAFKDLNRTLTPGNISNNSFCEFFFWTKWKLCMDALAGFAGNIDKRKAIYKKALDKLSSFTDKDGNNNGAWIQWRNCLLELVRLESAFAEKQHWIQEINAVADKRVRLTENSVESWIGWGDSLLELVDITPDTDGQIRLTEEALSKYDRASGVAPDSTDAWRCWGIGFLTLARLEPDHERKQSTLKEARARFERALDTACDIADYNAAARNLGSTLALLAETSASIQEESVFLTQAKAIYDKALSETASGSSNNRSYGRLWNGYGRVRLQQALLARRQTKTEESGGLLTEVAETLEKANRLDPACGSYNYACLELILGNEEGCLRYLNEAQERDELPHSTRLRSDPLLREVQNKKWFTEIITSKIRREAEKEFND
jgi:hypothetical protein